MNSKADILKKVYPVLINCFAGSHGEIFGEYWIDPKNKGEMPDQLGYTSVEGCYRDLRDDIYIYEYDDEVWAEIDNEVGDDPYEKVRRVMLHNCSHGEVWGSVCSQLFHSKVEYCWRLLADLLESLENEHQGRIGWDS